MSHTQIPQPCWVSSLSTSRLHLLPSVAFSPSPPPPPQQACSCHFLVILYPALPAFFLYSSVSFCGFTPAVFTSFSLLLSDFLFPFPLISFQCFSSTSPSQPNIQPPALSFLALSAPHLVALQVRSAAAASLGSCHHPKKV